MKEVGIVKEYNIGKPQQIVVCAACRCGKVIFCGARHWDTLMHLQAEAAGCTSPGEQGFVDQFGTFLTRKEAFKIVHENGQQFNKEKNGSSYELYSEGLY